MRRTLSILSLSIAWLCANGSLWNVMQLVAWAKMFHDYSQIMPAVPALSLTFDLSKPCEICTMIQHGRDATRDTQSPVLLSTGDKLVLACETAAPVVMTAPDFYWPDVVNDVGPARSETVPLPPPRV